LYLSRFCDPQHQYGNVVWQRTALEATEQDVCYCTQDRTTLAPKYF